MTTTAWNLATQGNFSQNWSNAGLITVNDDWSGVPSIVGYRGDGLTAATGTDPQAILVDGTPVIDVNANQTNPNTFTTGGVTEFALADPTIALAGSGTAAAPSIVVYLNTVGVTNVGFSFRARDLENGADTAQQQIAVQYRVGNSGNWTNIPAGYIADATTGPNASGPDIPVSVILPAAAEGQADVQVRIITTNAPGNDEWVGIDDIQVTASSAPALPSLSIANNSITEGDSGTKTLSFTVSRAGDTTGVTTVDFGTANGSAIAGTDYVAASGPITFLAGETSKTVSVTIDGDTDVEADETFSVTLSNASGATIAASTATGTIINDDQSLVKIYDIQGAGHRSSYVGGAVANGAGGNSGTVRVTTQGVVTALGSNGFFMQDATGDGNNATSDGIFVFTNAAPAVIVGHLVQVTGRVDEFRPGGSSGTNNLTITELNASSTISGASISDRGVGPTITAVDIGPSGRQVPTGRVTSDNFVTYDPSTNAADFFESLEGMLVRIVAPVTVSGTNEFSATGGTSEEIWVVPTGSFDASSLNSRGGLALGETDTNPERIQIDDLLNATDMPTVNTGALLSDVTGVVNYDFGTYEVLTSSAPTVISAGTLTPEVTNLKADRRGFTVGDYNVNNLDPKLEDITKVASNSASNVDDDTARFAVLARHIVTNLKAPTILSLQEIQDSSGAEQGDGILDADGTLNTLIAAITAAGGPTYSFAQISPTAENINGGQPGGNIRPAFLYDASVATLVPNSLQQIDPTNPAFNSSRKPLQADFLINGVKVTIIDNHWNSKGGDQAIFGNNQPPTLTSEVQRSQQAAIVKARVDALLAADPNANIMVVGDLNDFAWSNPLKILEGSGANQVLFDLAEEKISDPKDRYTYNFNGSTQAIDHMLVSANLKAILLSDFDIVHVNAEFGESDPSRASDHDPSVALFSTRGASETLVGLTNEANTIDGEGGDDTITGGNMVDLLYGGIGNDKIFGRGGDDSLLGGEGNDEIIGGDGNDYILGQNGNDILNGDDGTDSIFGGEGKDIISGGRDNDSLYGEAGDDIIHAGFGDDFLAGGDGNDQLNGNDGNDFLLGGDGDDLLVGGLGNDVLYGEGGNDRLVMDDGVEVAYGGTGADTFYWNSPSQGADCIADFSHAEGDILEFDHTAFGVSYNLGLTQGVNFFVGADVVSTQAVATVFFDTTTNMLWFDADGTGAASRQGIAVITNGAPGLAAGDIRFS
jgi:predicted extracellular nuclease